MIDDDDVDDAGLIAMLMPEGGGWCGVILGVLAVVFVIAMAVVASMNHEDCAKKQCPDGMRPELMRHSCLCVTEAK